MNLRKANEYNIGLDIGTSSVGWAVTDLVGKLLYFNGKPTWGSRLFTEANKASEARGYRSQRRRLARRRWRLNLLQDIFKTEMDVVDPEFFIQLNQSRLHPEDRGEHSEYRWPIFNNSNFTEVDYYKKFPTIYHLRNWLLNADEKADLRLIYLAFHNIVKNRGNFLRENNKDLSSKNAKIDESINALCQALDEWCEMNGISCSASSNIDDINAVLSGRHKNRSETSSLLNPLIVFSCNDVIDTKVSKGLSKSISDLVVGLKGDLKNLLFLTKESPEGLTTKIDLSNDEALDAIRENCSDELITLLDALVSVYSSYVLQDILKKDDYLSANKVEEYIKYGEDLSLLKSLFNKYCPEKYDDFFRGEINPNGQYASTNIGYTLYNSVRKTKYDEFKKEIEKALKDTGAEDDPRYKQMEEELKEGKFLKRQKTSDNGVIPYQLHLEEMLDIIEKQKQHYPFLGENADKLRSLVEFRIPYYVGPLSTKNARKVNDNPDSENRFAWSVRYDGKDNEKIYPWNWDEIIDRNSSAEKFITRMTGTCTYIIDEPVLPRQALLYEEFCVLNELNGVKFTQDGDKFRPLDYSDKVDAVEELFKNGGVTQKKFEEWMRQRGHHNVHIRGFQGQTGFESKLTSYIFFKKDIFQTDEISIDDYPMIEDIIRWNTLFEDRAILKDKIKQNYGSRLSDEQIKKICKKKMAGWGKLSKKLLLEIETKTEDGPRSIIEILKEGKRDKDGKYRSVNLMQILHDDELGFNKIIDEINSTKFSNFEHILLSDIPGSPAIRRSINQAIKIVDEIVGIAGCNPKNIFVEVARTDDDRSKGKMTQKRIEAIENQLKALKQEAPEYYDDSLLKLLKNNDSSKLNEKLTLYLMQAGKSLYSMEPLYLDKFDEYQVDHILPQSYIKDDSFENKALVLASENQRKSDQMLLPKDMQKKMKPYWDALLAAGLIGEKKYKNLTRTFVDEKLMKGFINRQLVETNQSIKILQQILSSKFEGTNIRAVKAGLTSELRKRLELVKCRDVNDFHHAHDAFLACQIGNFINTRFPEMFENPLHYHKAISSFIKREAEGISKGKRPYGTSFIISSFMSPGFDVKTGEVMRDAWNADFVRDNIHKSFNYWQCHISKMPEETSGPFWDQNAISPYDKRKGSKLTLRLKTSLDTSKYGGYSGEQFAYFALFLAEENKGKLKRVLLGVPIAVAYEIEKQIISIEVWASQRLAEDECMLKEVIRHRILKYTLLHFDNDVFYLPALDAVYSSRQLILDQDYLGIAARICNVEKFADEDISEEELIDLYDTLVNKSLILCSKFQSVYTCLSENKSHYLNLQIPEKRKLIVNLLRFFKGSSARVDLSLIGGPANAGGIRNTFILDCKNTVIFIDQSVTGMFERRTEIGL